MMENKRSVGVTLFGWSEIILGGIGTVIFAFFLIFFIYCLLYPTQTEIGGAMALMGMFIFLPSPFLLWAGIGVIKLKPFARKINLILIIIISILTIIALFYHLSSLIYCAHHQNMLSEFNMFKGYAILDIIVFLVLILPLFLFITNPKVKEQFK